MSILLVVLIISFLILIHELGHYLAAKKIGVKVEEFGFGYPPRAWKMFHWKGTDFTVNWLPFGGFVRLFGDSAETVESGGVERSGSSTQHHSSSTEAYPHNHFEGKSISGRLFVILAGAVINIVVGILAFTVIYSQIGVPTVLPHPLISEVAQDSPAAKAGLRSGDELLEVAGVPVFGTQQFISAVQERRGESVDVRFRREAKEQTVQVYARTVQETPEGQGSFGLILKDMEFVHYAWWQMPFYSIRQGVVDSWMFTRSIFSSLGSMFSGMFSRGEVPKDVAGPVGIVHMANRENLAQQGWMAVLSFTGVISLNLGVMNLLPIPALDGGRAVFLVLERVLGKKRRIFWEQRANLLGMTVLLTLIVLISVKDVWTIFRP